MKGSPLICLPLLFVVPSAASAVETELVFSYAAWPSGFDHSESGLGIYLKLGAVPEDYAHLKQSPLNERCYEDHTDGDYNDYCITTIDVKNSFPSSLVVGLWRIAGQMYFPTVDRAVDFLGGLLTANAAKERKLAMIEYVLNREGKNIWDTLEDIPSEVLSLPTYQDFLAQESVTLGSCFECDAYSSWSQTPKPELVCSVQDCDLPEICQSPRFQVYVEVMSARCQNFGCRLDWQHGCDIWRSSFQPDFDLEREDIPPEVLSRLAYQDLLAREWERNDTLPEVCHDCDLPEACQSARFQAYVEKIAARCQDLDCRYDWQLGCDICGPSDQPGFDLERAVCFRLMNSAYGRGCIRVPYPPYAYCE